jgi:hypothetical protein
MNADPRDHPYAGPVSRRCRKPVDPANFKPGHSVHWIQAKKAAKTRGSAEIGEIVSIDQRGIHLDVAGEIRRYGTRDLERVESLVATHGHRVRIQHRWSLMHLGNALISIQGPL